MARSSQSYWAIAFGLMAWSLLLFSPLAFVSSANAQETELDYGTVIGIVSHDLSSLDEVPFLCLTACLFRIWVPHILASV